METRVIDNFGFSAAHHMFTADVFKSPLSMLEKFEAYILWAEDHPLMEAKIGSFNEIVYLPKMRVLSMEGFARYCRTSSIAIGQYMKKGQEYVDLISFMKDTIHAMAYEGAAAGLLKEAIITRKLGLADKIEQSRVERHIVILHTPDNQRAIEAPDEENWEDAKLLDEE